MELLKAEVTAKKFIGGTKLPILLKTNRRPGGREGTKLPFARVTKARKTKPQPIVVPESRGYPD